MANLKDISKDNYGGDATDKHIELGCLQRIADATELMASNFIALQNERDMYKRRYNEGVEARNSRDKTISNLRGQITKLKNKLKKQG